MRDLKGKSDQDILDTIVDIQRACRDGEKVLMLNADGDLMYGC